MDLWVIFPFHGITELLDFHKHTHNFQALTSTAAVRDDDPSSNLVIHSVVTNIYKTLIFRTTFKSPSSAVMF